MYRASATKAVDLGSLSARVKPKILKFEFHSFFARHSAITERVWSLLRLW